MNDEDQLPPPDPMSDLAAGAAMAHELFLELCKKGFTEQQALYLTAQILIGKPL